VLNPRRRPKAFLAAVAAVLLLLGGAAAAAYFTVLKAPGDFSDPNVPFVGPEPTPEKKKGKKPKKLSLDHFKWPRYGYTKDHRRVFEPGRAMNGPWRAKWKRKAAALTEFPPAISDGLILQLADNARLVARDLMTGKRRWRRQLGKLSASSPAIEDGRVYVTLLEGRGGGERGRVVCLRLKDGKILWSHGLSSRSESSPLVHQGRVFFGSEGGTLYAFDARTGRQDWTYRAAGAVKGSPTLSDGLLYFGDYGGQVQAVRARDGARVWAKGAARGFLRSGRFYATAAVAFGRVYVGSTDGRVFSMSARDGRVAWAHQTGRYVYSSAAVKVVNGIGPTIYVGSYDGVFYALDARSGKVRWRYRSGGKISGSPTIVGDTVYFADLGRARTFGLNVRNGNVVFRYELGAYDPVISDGVHLYITGNRSLTALEPRRLLKQRRKQKRKRQQAKKAAARYLVTPAWPKECRQLVPCGPLAEARHRRMRAGG